MEPLKKATSSNVAMFPFFGSFTGFGYRVEGYLGFYRHHVRFVYMVENVGLGTAVAVLQDS